MTRDQILDALQYWINQRPGLDPRNYISHGWDAQGRRAYRSESRRITRHLHDARVLLSAVRWCTGIDVPQLQEAFRAFSGRLQLKATEKGCTLEYCAGQYWPTEYRAAACAVLAAAIWDYTRENMPKMETGAGDWIRAKLRREFGANLQRKWMD